MKMNKPFTTSKAGMSLLELTVVILVLLSLITILFVGARAWKRASDRSANIMNIRDCQQAMRAAQNMKKLIAGTDTFSQIDLEEYMQYPRPVNATLGAYLNKGIITPSSAVPAVDWDHIWLEPGDPSGFPTGLYGHASYNDVTGW